MKTVCVQSLEDKFVTHLDQQGLGCPSESRVCVSEILSGITVNQGFKATGEWTSCLRLACDKIESMLVVPETMALEGTAAASLNLAAVIEEKEAQLLEKDAALTEMGTVITELLARLALLDNKNA